MIWVFPILRFFKHEKWKHGMKSVCFTLQVSDEKRRRRSSSSYLEYRRLWRSGHWPNWNRIEPRSVISIQSNRQRHGLFAPRCTATTQQKPPPLPPPQAQSNPFLKPFQSNVFSGRHPSLLFSLYIVCETVFCILRKARLPIYKENCGLSKKKKKIVSQVQMCLSNRELTRGAFLIWRRLRNASVFGRGSGWNWYEIWGVSGHHTRCWHDLDRWLGLHRTVISEGPFHAAPSVVVCFGDEVKYYVSRAVDGSGWTNTCMELGLFIQTRFWL